MRIRKTEYFPHSRLAGTPSQWLQACPTKGGLCADRLCFHVLLGAYPSKVLLTLGNTARQAEATASRPQLRSLK
eukprot:367263-Amphidinium_carterae.2